VIKGAAKGGIPGDVDAQGEKLSDLQILREVARWVALLVQRHRMKLF
jgi:hypothetical protein